MKQNKVIGLGSAAVLAVTGAVAFAQQNNAPNAANNGAMMQFTKGTLQDEDKQYVEEIGQGSIYEFAIAELAVERSPSEAVQQYASKVMDDHAQYNKLALTLARQKSMTIPVFLVDEDRQKVQRLMGMYGKDFDRAYLKEMVKINSEDVSKAEKEANSAQDQDVKSFVTYFLPGDREHLKMARELQSSVGRMTSAR